MAGESGSSAVLGVIVGAVLVLIVLFLVFGGFGVFDGGGGDVDVDIKVPEAAPGR